jgi:DNA (cytosine-5)-methyltransferase 1
MNQDLRFVELFAGCGGMSLGLKAAGFKLAFANELSPMAAETYAYNLLPNGMDDTFWLKSKFSRTDIRKRLMENPTDYTLNSHGDFRSPMELPASNPFMLVGDISIFLDMLRGSVAENFRKHIGPIDLLSGGPPCQSFSFAGKREIDNKRNSLFLQFAKMASVLQPKAIIFENVSGIIHPFTNGDGSQKHTWFEVVKEFIRNGYVPVCFHINTKELGIPQHRTRFIMVALKEDLVTTINSHKSPYFKKFARLFNGAWQFYNEFEDAIEKCKIPYNEKKASCLLFDGTSGSWSSMFNPFFNSTLSGNYGSVMSAIDSVKNLECRYKAGVGKYGKFLRKHFAEVQLNNEQDMLQNHENRTHSDLVKARFMLLQAVSELEEKVRHSYFSTTRKDDLRERDIPAPVITALMKHALGFLDENDNIYKWGPNRIIATRKEIKRLIIRLRSRKQAQRALVPSMPAPAQLSIPDDLCHYDQNNPRTLTVREMARIQTFPDWFVFKGKPTTGGRKRSFEVPQYTQVGNAVPPLLAKVIGINLKNLLLRLNEVGSP